MQKTAAILAILTLALAGCQTARLSETGPKALALYSSLSGAGKVVANIDAYGSGTVLDLASANDRTYRYCLAAKAPDSSYGGDPYCMVNFNLRKKTGIDGFGYLVFKLRQDSYSDFSLIINNNKGYPAFPISSYATALKGDWVQVRLPLGAVPSQSFSGGINQFLLSFPGKGNILLTDLGFE